MASRLSTSLALLKRLNDARRIGQHDAAAELDRLLEEHDARCGYSRPIVVEPVLQHGQRPNGRQRRDA